MNKQENGKKRRNSPIENRESNLENRNNFWEVTKRFKEN